jgi:hypothetical protein
MMSLAYDEGQPVETDRFADYMARERARIHEDREAIINRQAQLEAELNTLNREMAAIDAYEAAKAGKLPTAPARVSRGVRAQGVRAARSGSKREQLVQLVSNNPQGLSRGELLELIGVKGDRSGEMSVSNALTALIKANTLDRNEAKKYVLAAAA